METLTDVYFKFNPDTIQEVRKEFNLDQRRVNEAIDILEEWLKKQEHFLKKDFSRDYLERLVIFNKGLLERTKNRIDRKCTLRNLLADFYTPCSSEENEDTKSAIIDCFMPKLTPNHERIYLVKFADQEYTPQRITNYFKRSVVTWEYLLAHDYNKGFREIWDLRETNILDLLKNSSLNEVRQFSALALGGYGFRLRSVHVITSSKFVDALFAFFQQIFPKKIFERMKVHRTLESLHKEIPKQILPFDYGGEDKKTLAELSEQMHNVMRSEEHVKFMEEMNQARTDESRRPVDKFNEEYLGIPGTFRTLVMD